LYDHNWNNISIYTTVNGIGDIMDKETILGIAVCSFIMFVVVMISLLLGINSTFDNYDPIMDWYYTEDELLDYNDPGYGHAGVLDDIWHEANYGKKVNLDWYEDYRLKYKLDSVKSFYLINYSNVCPREPNLRYIGTGYIVNFIDWSYDSPAYSETTICINGSNSTYNNCAWNPYPYNKSCLTHVFREKHGAWWNQFKEARLFDASIYVDIPESNNQSWSDYRISYQKYLDNGGVNVGSEY